MAERSPSSRGAARRMLLAAISPDAGELARVLGDPAAAAVDWEWLIDRAIAHRVGALAVSRLQRCPIDWPDGARGTIDEIRVQAAQRAASAQQTLRELSAALAERGVSFLLVKGSVLAELVYGDPLIRPFYDVDIVVRRESLAAAEALMREWNYRLEGIWWLLGPRPQRPFPIDRAEAIARASYLRMFHNLSFAPRRDDARRPIELHWNIAPRGRLRVRDEDLWTRRTTVSVAGVEVDTLDPEAMLIHLAVHALEAWFHGFKLLHLYDVAWTVVRWQDRYTDLWELAEAWGATYQLELALRLIDRLSAVPAAGALLAGRRPSPWMRAALAYAGRPEVLVDRKVERSDTWAQRAAAELRWGMAVRGLRAKLGFSLERRVATARWRLAQRGLR